MVDLTFYSIALDLARETGPRWSDRDVQLVKRCYKE